MSDLVRIAMWSGPRNISTAMMRSWENRPDTAVWDEPLYAYYLKATGLDHPGRDEVIAHCETDWRKVVAALTGPVPDGKSVFFQKHMTHHVLPEVDTAWLGQVSNAFLIRDPALIIASYAATRSHFDAGEIGIVQQRTIFDEAARRLGKAPPVLAAEDILADPRGKLTILCDALDVPFTDAMLNWPAGRRASDGIWAKYWYKSVERSTGFDAAPRSAHPFPEAYREMLDTVRPHYEYLRLYCL